MNNLRRRPLGLALTEVSSRLPWQGCGDKLGPFSTEPEGDRNDRELSSMTICEWKL